MIIHPRRLLSEFIGTLGIVLVVVGSGIMAERLTTDVAVQLLANTIATAGGLVLFIYLLGPVSGAQFNPVVTLAESFERRFAIREVAPFIAVQVAGACAGAMISNVMFGLDIVNTSVKERAGGPIFLGEVVATAVLVFIIQGAIRSGRTSAIPFLVPAWITAAYWSTSSTSFANPAVSIGRSLSNTFAGIAPSSLLMFILGQLVGGALGLILARSLFVSQKITEPLVEKV